MKANGHLKAVDLFSGAGGGSMGLQYADIEVVGAADIDSAAVDTYQNSPVPVDPWEVDLTKVTFHDIGDYFDFDPDEIDLVMGCPPCQNFSSLRDTRPWPEDEPKDELLKAFYQHVREAFPQYVLFENVPGIIQTDGGAYLEWLKRRMRELGYGMAIDVLNAADYGVPQKRKRTIGLFVKGADDDEVQLPKPTHGPPDVAKQNAVSRYRNVRDEIGDLPPLKSGESWDGDAAHRARNHQESTLEIIRAVPDDGGSRTEIEDEELILDCHKRLGDSNGAGSVYGRMSWDDPAPTLTTRCTSPSCGRFIHPEQNRGITFREAARLMGFPDFDLPSKNSEAERVVGNAVPPKLIQSIVNSGVPLQDGR